MRDKEDKDKTQLNSELKELIRVIDHDKKLKEFMKIKTQERQEDEELISWRKKKEQEAAEKRRKEKEEHSVEAYESKFREIELITGETDLDKLVDRFIQVRTPNLAMFALIPNDHLLGYYPQEYWFIIIELIICNVEFLRRLRR